MTRRSGAAILRDYAERRGSVVTDMLQASKSGYLFFAVRSNVAVRAGSRRDPKAIGMIDSCSRSTPASLPVRSGITGRMRHTAPPPGHCACKAKCRLSSGPLPTYAPPCGHRACPCLPCLRCSALQLAPVAPAGFPPFSFCFDCQDGESHGIWALGRRRDTLTAGPRVPPKPPRNS